MLRYISLLGPQARKEFDTAQSMLKTIVDEKLLQANGVVGLFPAYSDGDDIRILDIDDHTTVIDTLFGLRQQAERQVDQGGVTLCLSDFVAPKSTGIIDYVGMFAVSAGFGSAELCEKFANALYYNWYTVKFDILDIKKNWTTTA